MSSRPAPAPDDAATTQAADGAASWFSELGETAAPSGEPRATSARWWKSPAEPMPEPARSLRLEGSPYARMYRAFLAARAALGVLLIMGVITSTLFSRSINPQILTVAIGYATLALLWWWWPSQRID